MKRHTPHQLVIACDLGQLERKMISMIKSAELLHEQNDYSTHCNTFHLLASIAFEVLPKIIIGCEICLDNVGNNKITEDGLRKKIYEEMKNKGHNVKIIIDDIKNLKKDLGIKEIRCIPNKINTFTKENSIPAWEYHIKLKEKDSILSIKNIEAIRYGSLAKNRDVQTIAINDGEILSFLKKFMKYTSERKRKIYKRLL